MDRRALIAGLGTALVASARLAMAEDDKKGGHEHAAAHPRKKLIAETSHCIAVGEVCLDHCHKMLSHGDTTMAGCLNTVTAVIAVCTALRTLAAAESTVTPAQAKIAAKVCEDCEKECRKFEQDHEVCRDCAEACASCAKECRAVAV